MATIYLVYSRYTQYASLGTVCIPTSVINIEEIVRDRDLVGKCKERRRSGTGRGLFMHEKGSYFAGPAVDASCTLAGNGDSKVQIWFVELSTPSAHGLREWRDVLAVICLFVAFWGYPYWT